MMDSTTIFPRPRIDGFPTGLRVLVVDDDLTWLKILEKMLKKCFYEVTTCCLARDALSILRDRKDRFDIVISDVNMPDMDGFKLLELLGLEMDLPVIMMSVDGETSRVMKGVQHGACDYLLKPIRMKELRNIWQHVLRKRINDVQSFDEVIKMMRIGNDQQHQTLSNHADITASKKRKDVADKIQICSTEMSDSSSKRARVVWTVDLHQKFVKAVKLIGIEKIGPKKILDSMNVGWLTRENVASHLQKYRLYLSRLQKDNNGDKSFEVSDHLDVDFCKLKHSDLLTNDDPKEIFFGDQRTDADKRGSIAHYSSCETADGVPETKSRKPELIARDCELVQSDSRFADPELNVLPKYSWNEDVSVEHYFGNVGEQHQQQHQRIDYGFNHCFHSELALVAFGKDYKIRWDDQSDYNGSENFHGRDEAAVPVHLFDALRFAPSCPTMMDQSVSIVDSAHFSSSYYPVS